MHRLRVISNHIGIPTSADVDAPFSAVQSCLPSMVSSRSSVTKYIVRALNDANPGEKDQLGALTKYVFAGGVDGGWDGLRNDWILGTFDGDRLVSSHGFWPFTMRANGSAVKMAGVTAVGTLPEYRRQGLLRRMVEHAFTDFRQQGIPCAALWPSQAAIYQRYGYTFASVLRTYRVDVVDINFADGDNGTNIVTRSFSVDDARQDLKMVYTKFIADRIGYNHRSRTTWDAGPLRPTMAPIHVAISRSNDGSVLGYVIYTLESGKVRHAARPQRLTVRELVWLDMNAYRSLWTFLAGHDMVGEVVWETAPSDDPALEIWMEPRMLHHIDRMGFMFRLVDVAPALEQRQYNASGVVTLVVANDTLSPWNNGCWQLTVQQNNAQVELLDSVDAAENIIKVSIKSLSALYIGFRTARNLASWGMVQGSAAAIEIADRMFMARHAPHSPDLF